MAAGTKEKSAPAPRSRRSEGDLGTQLRALVVHACHPRQALVFFALGLGSGLALHRGVGEALAAGFALLLTQAALGLDNDVVDRERDAESNTSGKPVAGGLVPPGNASFAIVCLVLLSVPVALTNGWLAGICALATLPVGYVSNRVLHRTIWSWVPWAVTGALVPAFLSYGGWGLAARGPAPTWAVSAFAAALGIGVHFLTSLPDLVADNRAGVRHLPLRVALRTGAPRLLVLSGLFTALVTAGLVVSLVKVGLHQG